MKLTLTLDLSETESMAWNLRSNNFKKVVPRGKVELLAVYIKLAGPKNSGVFESLQI